MTITEIEEYLLKLENKLIIESDRKKIELTRDWANSFPNQSAVYIIREDEKICYVGETGSIRGRMNDILNTKNHTLRRNLGSSHFSEHPNYEKATSKKSFPPEVELMLNDRIQNHLTISYIVVDLGRKELEERLYAKLDPKYNLKGKRGTTKAYSKAEKQVNHKNAYEKWTVESDEKLERLFCERKTIAELSKIFGRNDGAIRSRIKKLELKEKYRG